MYVRSRASTVWRRALPGRRHAVVRRTPARSRLHTWRPIGHRRRPSLRGRRR